MPLLVLFILLPMAELWLLIKVGSAIGPLTTVLTVIFTALLGVTLLRIQGFSALLRAQQKMAAGELPAEELVQGVFLAAGGLLLLVPGFITDAVGFLCLTPGIRSMLVGGLLKRSRGRVFMAGGFSANDSASKTPAPDVIEGEYRREP